MSDDNGSESLAYERLPSHFVFLKAGQNAGSPDVARISSCFFGIECISASPQGGVYSAAMQPAPSVANFVTVIEMILAQWNGAAIAAAAKFGIADKLESGPKDYKGTGVSSEPSRRVPVPGPAGARRHRHFP